MQRRSLWTMNCWEIDMALAMNFDERELLNAMSSCDIDRVKPAACCMSQRDYTIGLAHALCHEENPFSLLIQRQLDSRHRWARERIEHMCVHEIGRFASLPVNWLALSSWVWAMLVDTRREANHVGAMLARRKLFEGMAMLETVAIGQSE